MDPQHQPAPPVFKSTWPTTFGILGIIFGIFGFLYSAYQVFTMAIMTKMGGFPMTVPPTVTASSSGTGTTTADQQQQEEIVEAMEKGMADMMSGIAEIAKTKIYVDGALVIVSLLLFIGGLLLLQRFRISKMILSVWAYAKILVGLAGIYLTQKYMTVWAGSMGQIMDDSVASSGSGSAPSFNFTQIYEAMGTVVMVLGFIWVCILPVLILVWLNRQPSIDDMKNGYGWK